MQAKGCFCKTVAKLPLIYHIMNFFRNIFCKFFDFYRSFIAFTLLADRNFTVCGFFFTHNQHVWDVLHFVITNLAADFLVTVIHQRADVVFLQFQTNLVAYSLNFSEIGRTATWSGVSHNGNLPAVCSIKTATKRSIEPNGAR